MHVTELTEKQLRNMNTQRLNEIRKKLTTIVAKFKSKIDIGICTEAEFSLYRKNAEQFELVKELLSEREHLETKKVKTPRRENKRDRNYDF